MKQVVIVGGGFSGVMTAINLANKCNGKGIQITLIEKNKNSGHGPAYSTEYEEHRLNVPCQQMGAIHAKPDHFQNWLIQSGKEIPESKHVPRKWYNEYLESLLHETSENYPDIIEIVNDEAIDCQGNKIVLKSGTRIPFDFLIIAIGNFPPANLKSSDPSYINHPAYLKDPWKFELDKVKDKKKILLIGTSLTMADICISLFKIGYKEIINAVSNHGYLPYAHQPSKLYRPFTEELEGVSSISKVLKIVRQHIRNAAEAGIDWRGVIDSMRNYNQQIWLNLGLQDKKIFLKRLGRIWNITRHRIPPEYNNALQTLLEKGQLIISAARIKDITTAGNCLKVDWELKSNKTLISKEYDYVINCTGPESDYSRIEHPYVKNLISKGIIKADQFRLGIDATVDGEVIDQNQNISHTIFTLGPTLKGILGESTAVPELRDQAYKLSELIFSRL